MEQSRAVEVIGRDGLRGTVQSVPDTGTAEIRLEGGRTILVPVELLGRQADGSYHTPLATGDLPRPLSRPDVAAHVATGQSVTVPVAQESLNVEIHKQETGTTAVHIVPSTRTEHLRVALAEEQVHIERVAVNEFVDAPRPVREEGDTTIVPVYDEVLVVERRLMLREEVHIRRERVTRQEQQDIPLRTEEVHILRSEPPPATT